MLLLAFVVDFSCRPSGTSMDTLLSRITIDPAI
jgi:hypothetical protein